MKKPWTVEAVRGSPMIAPITARSPALWSTGPWSSIRSTTWSSRSSPESLWPGPAASRRPGWSCCQVCMPPRRRGRPPGQCVESWVHLWGVGGWLRRSPEVRRGLRSAGDVLTVVGRPSLPKPMEAPRPLQSPVTPGHAPCDGRIAGAPVAASLAPSVRARCNRPVTSGRTACIAGFMGQTRRSSSQAFNRGSQLGRTPVNGPEVVDRAVVDTIEEPSMRAFEYAICAFAGIAALLLGLVR